MRGAPGHFEQGSSGPYHRREDSWDSSVPTGSLAEWARRRGVESAMMFPVASGSELASMVPAPSTEPPALDVPEALDELSCEEENMGNEPRPRSICSPVVRKKIANNRLCPWCSRRTFLTFVGLLMLIMYPSMLPPDTSLVFDSSLPINGTNIACFRIPSVVQTSDGLLVAFAEGRIDMCADCAITGIAAARSLDGGRSWLAPTWLIEPNDTIAANPTAAWDDVSGRIILQYVRGQAGLGPPHQPCNPARSNWQVASKDGVTWTAPTEVSQFLGRWSGALVGPGSGIQLTAGRHRGRILFAGHWGVYNTTRVWFSDNGGETYQLGQGGFNRFDESQLVELDDGKVPSSMPRARTCTRACACCVPGHLRKRRVPRRANARARASALTCMPWWAPGRCSSTCGTRSRATSATAAPWPCRPTAASASDACSLTTR